MDENQKVALERISCMAQVLSAIKDCYVADRSIKDNIINSATAILTKDLKVLENS